MAKKLLFLVLLPILGYGVSLTSHITPVDGMVFLATKGSPVGASAPNFDDSAWTRVSLPTNLREVLGEAEEYWIRLHLYVPEDLDKLSAISLGYVYSSDAFYINGELRGSYGIFPLYQAAPFAWRFYTLFPLVPGETNILAWHIKGQVYGYTGVYNEVQVGPFIDLFGYIYAMDIVSLVFFIVYVVLIVYFLLFFIRRPAQTDYLAFSLFLLALVVYSITRLELKYFFLRDYHLWDKIEFGAYYLLMPLGVLFFGTAVRDQNKIGKIRIGRSIFLFSLLMGIPGWIIVFLPDYWRWAGFYNFRIYQLVVFPLAFGYVVYILFQNIKRDKKALLFLLGFLIVIIGAVYDTLVARQIIQTRPIMPFAFFAFIIFYAIVLANQFVDLYHEVEEMNVNLEEKVKQRTSELQATNEKLLLAQRQIQFELGLAQKIQQSMIPTDFRPLSPVELHGIYMPMEELGGDFYDVYKISDRYLHVVVADVSGHGVPSALITMMAKAYMSYYSKDSNDPAQIVAVLNRELCRQLLDVENYITLFYGVLDTSTNVFRYVNAGHVTIFHLAVGGTIHQYPAQTPFLGKFEGITFTSQEVQMSAGDKLVLYTDGITETRNHEGRMFGEGHFMDFLVEHSGESPEVLTSLILDEVKVFRGDLLISDDITLLTVQVPGDYHEPMPVYEVEKVYEKALMSYKENNLDEAQKLLEHLMRYQELPPEDAYRVYLLAGTLAYQKGNYKEAYQFLERALFINPASEKLRLKVENLRKMLEKGNV